MKILFCTAVFESSAVGPAKFTTYLQALNQSPLYEITLHTLTEDIATPTSTIKKITVKYPRFIHFLGLPLRSFTYYKKIIKLHQKHHYDFIVFNTMILSLFSVWKLGDRVKTIGFINDDNLLRQGLFDFKHYKKYFLNTIFKPFEYISTRLVGHVITNSDYMTNQIAQTYRIDKRKISRLYKGIDIDKIDFVSPRTIDLTLPIKILFVKNDWRRGGLIDLIQALNLLVDYIFELTIIGVDHRAKQQIANISTDEHVQIKNLGKKQPREVYAAMRFHDLLCVPSRQEALGVVNMEGLAHGIPVITTNVGGIREVTEAGKHVWAALPQSPDILAATIKKCLVSSKERTAKSESGRRYIESNFNQKKMLDEFVKIIESL